MQDIISIFSLLVAIVALVFTYLQTRNQIRPNIKIALINSNEVSETMQIELTRLSQCYQFTSIQVICQQSCTILDYGMNEFELRLPQNLQPSSSIELNYWINANFTSQPESVVFWFSIAKSNHNRSLRLKFRHVLSPYYSSCEIKKQRIHIIHLNILAG